MSFSNTFRRVSPWILAALLCIIYILFACFTYPLFSKDSAAFLPTAIHWKSGLGLTNPIFDFLHIVDPIYQKRFVYYMPLMPLLIGTLMPFATVQSACLVMAGFNSLNLLTSLYSWRQLKKPPLRLTLLSLLGLSTYFAARGVGRPEVLGSLWVTLSLCVCLSPLNKTFKPLGLGILLGLMACTHPLGAILMGCILICYYSFFSNLKQTIVQGASSFSVALLTFLGVMLLWCPYPLQDMLMGIYRHGQLSLTPEVSGALFLPKAALISYFFIPHLSFFGLLLIVCLLLGILWIRQNWHSINSKPIFVSSLVVLAIIIFNASIKAPHSSYNIFMFCPLLFTFMLSQANNCSLHWLQKHPRILMAVLTSILILTSSGFLRSLLLFPYFLKDGTHLAEAQKIIQPYYQNSTQTFYVTGALWPLFSHFNRVKMYPDPLFRQAGERPSQYGYVVIFQKFYQPGNTQYPFKPLSHYDGHPLIWHNYCPVKPQFLGVPLSKSVPGYQFALYGPAKAQP